VQYVARREGKVGDWLHVGARAGRVLHVWPRATLIRYAHGSCRAEDVGGVDM
jgi:small-conductance mechanosensitive channel